MGCFPSRSQRELRQIQVSLPDSNPKYDFDHRGARTNIITPTLTKLREKPLTARGRRDDVPVGVVRPWRRTGGGLQGGLQGADGGRRQRGGFVQVSPGHWQQQRHGYTPPLHQSTV